MTAALPEWPERVSHPPSRMRHTLAYERARADAWEARCRYLLELMAHIENCSDIDEWPHQEVKQAVAFIGPLPLPQTREGGE